MSEYGHHITKGKPTPLLSYNAVNEAKEQRKKLLAAEFQRRQENYKRFIQKKRPLQADDDLI